MFEKKKSNEIVLLNEDISFKQAVKIKYVLVTCQLCGSEWGVSPADNKASMKDFVCRKCLVDKYYTE